MNTGSENRQARINICKRNRSHYERGESSAIGATHEQVMQIQTPTTGFSISASRLALPDVGLISFGEVADQGSLINGSVSIPVIGDGDNGYGNAMNVKRTVKGFITAGFSGIILEDQVSPKACGHTQGRRVVSREDSIVKLKAAIDARKETNSDIVIVARTDSRQAVSFEEAIWRSKAFCDLGVDVVFIDALASKEEMKAFCEICPLVPNSTISGFGKCTRKVKYRVLVA